MLTRLVNSIRYRARMARFGIYYLRSFQLRQVRVAGRRVHLSFPPAERATHEWELGRILFEDCYGLSNVPGPVRTVVDIGANIGLFALAARHFFPQATIYSYEPNVALEPHLQAHCQAVGASYRLQAVGAKPGRVDLHPAENSLHSVSQESTGGAVEQTTLAAILKETGPIDLLKLDCEGAEWAIFEDAEPWRHVRALTMEYHLWARPGLTAEDLSGQLERLGFGRIEIEPSPKGTFGFARAVK